MHRSSGVQARLLTLGIISAVVMPLAIGCGASDVSSSGESEADVPSAVQDALSEEGVVELLDPVCCEGSLYAEVLAEVIERAGGEANVTQVADLTQHFPILADDTVGVSPSIWDFSAPEQFAKYVDREGTIAKLPSEIQAKEGWFVPNYVFEGDPDRGIEPVCPGLPDWEVLNDCAAEFATSETGDNGAFLTAGREWAKYYGDTDRIKNLGLNYEIVFTGSEAALTAAIKRAYDRGEPFVALAWEPHYSTLKHDLTRVEFPPYSDECWGSTYACQWPDIKLFSIMSEGFAAEQPTAYEIVENSDLNNEDMLGMMIAIEDEGLSFAEAAEEWVDANPERWSSWIPDEPVSASDAEAETGES